MIPKKRFWTEATAGDAGEILLDGRAIRTPAGAPLRAPTRTAAEAAAQEWNTQTGAIDAARMPITRALNSAIDRVAPQHAEVVEIVAAYGASDLLCYRADHPAALAARQAEAWDPLLSWAEERYGARLVCGIGVMHVAQPPGSVAALGRTVAAFDPFALTALHDLVALSGSLVLGLAVAEGRLKALNAWNISRIDEDWQAEQWGVDAEAEAAAAIKHADFEAAARFISLLKT
jgi:chaperone required for assembly of F1-ATPase